MMRPATLPNATPSLKHFEPLTPTSFLGRSASVFRDRPAVLYRDEVLTYGGFLDLCTGMASALRHRALPQGGRVAVLAPNTPTMLAAHFAVPWAGGVLVPLNHRLTDGDLGYIVEHSGASILLVDPLFAERGATIAHAPVTPLRVVSYEDILAEVGDGTLAGPFDDVDEFALLSINYTSGTTGRPKGVMYSHRGAYLQSLAMCYHTNLRPDSVMLWTLPMFHCNGWSFPWAVTAAGATHVCLDDMDLGEVWRHLRRSGVTHFNAAPTVLAMLAGHREAAHGPLPRRVYVATGGAPPSPSLLERLDRLNIEVTHLYGLTETYGPSVICQRQPEWASLERDEQARLVARQGVGNVLPSYVRVVASDGRDVPRDATTMGEILFRGNNVTLGYFNDPDATRAATMDGWIRSGDLGVVHADGYIELRDRAKDLIISGGENISSVEVERALDEHPDVVEAAVVARPHPTWGETPVAYVVVRPAAGQDADALRVDLRAHLRDRLAGYKQPRDLVFVEELPKTATGKIQKTKLRRLAARSVRSDTNE